MVKLTSGREFEFKPLNKRQQLRIKDMAHGFVAKYPEAAKDSPIPMEAFYEMVIMGTGKRENEFNDWTDKEIVEAGSLIMKDSFLDDLNKKK